MDELIIYRTSDDRTEIQLRVDGDTVWLSQAEMAELFQTSVPNINIHIKNILESGELTVGATIKEDLIVRQEGERQVRRKVNVYSLPMILAVGHPQSSGSDLPGASGDRKKHWRLTHRIYGHWRH